MKKVVQKYLQFHQSLCRRQSLLVPERKRAIRIGTDKQLKFYWSPRKFYRHPFQTAAVVIFAGVQWTLFRSAVLKLFALTLFNALNGVECFEFLLCWLIYTLSTRSFADHHVTLFISIFTTEATKKCRLIKAVDNLFASCLTCWSLQLKASSFFKQSKILFWEWSFTLLIANGLTLTSFFLHANDSRGAGICMVNEPNILEFLIWTQNSGEAFYFSSPKKNRPKLILGTAAVERKGMSRRIHKACLQVIPAKGRYPMIGRIDKLIKWNITFFKLSYTLTFVYIHHTAPVESNRWGRN